MKTVTVLDLARRCEQNPLVTTSNVEPSGKDLVVDSVLNPGVFRFERKTWLLIRVVESPKQTAGYVTMARYKDGEIEILKIAKGDPHLDVSDTGAVCYKENRYYTSVSHLRLMFSEDGTNFNPTEHLNLIFGEDALEDGGIEDCRVTELNGIYYLTYIMVSSLGAGVGLIQTRDWSRFDRKGMILPPHNKDCAIFEEKIKDKYFALHRPDGTTPDGNGLWIAESPDLMHWGNHRCIARTRKGMWDSTYIGAGCSPIQTPQGWLVIYQGADQHNRSCLGAMLLDRKDLTNVIARSKSPMMEPSEHYELSGFPGNAIFSNGHLVIGDRLQLYYSTGNGICGAELSIQEILGTLTLNKK